MAPTFLRFSHLPLLACRFAALKAGLGHSSLGCRRIMRPFAKSHLFSVTILRIFIFYRRRFPIAHFQKFAAGKLDRRSAGLVLTAFRRKARDSHTLANIGEKILP